MSVLKNPPGGQCGSNSKVKREYIYRGQGVYGQIKQSFIVQDIWHLFRFRKYWMDFEYLCDNLTYGLKITVFKGDGMQKQRNERNQSGEKWAARDDWCSRSGQRYIYINK